MLFSKPKITAVTAEEILDSRGNPTIKATVFSGKINASASVPSGASTGSYEALELRDGDVRRFNGKGVQKAVHHVKNLIGPAIKGMSPFDQTAVDKRMLKLDGTPNKSKLGANAILGVSLAVARLAAKLSNQPLHQYLRGLADIKPSRKVPYLYANLINGGQHAATKLPFQEYILVPQVNDIPEAINIIYKVQNELKHTLKANIGDEGGFVLDISDPEEPLRLLMKACEATKTLSKVKFAIDVAASSFFQNGKYDFNKKHYSAAELADFYKRLRSNYPLLSIEDPFQEEDFDSFAALRKAFVDVLVVGDDLTVTNEGRLKMAVVKNSISAIIIKPNQIGSLTETLNTMRLAKENGIECIVSHRSGETNDDFIVDLALAFGVFGIKLGALQRGERIAKYNRFLEIL